ncbi:MAG: TraX family protein [Herbinix sp.]|nr:TraX family protein [Herbinix sp.]
MDTFKLKLFAIIAMLIDHIAIIFISPYTNYWLYVTCRGIGRLAFPIFVFLIVEGFYHTKNIKKYLMRLGVFALISELPYDLAFFKYHNGIDVVPILKNMFHSTDDFSILLNGFNEGQNVFFTLFLGLSLITIMDLIDKKFDNNNRKNIIYSNSIMGAFIVAFCIAADYMKTDYDYAGILMIVVFYLFRGSKVLIAISILIISGTILSDFPSFVQTHNFYAMISTLATLAMIPIAFYNGEKGKSVKYLFYIFYPAHLFCLFLVAQFI